MRHDRDRESGGNLYQYFLKRGLITVLSGMKPLLVFLLFVYRCILVLGDYEWITSDTISKIIDDNSRNNNKKLLKSLVSMEAFKSISNLKCEHSNNCLLNMKSINKDGLMIFIDAPCLDHFAFNYVPKIKNPYIIIVHYAVPWRGKAIMFPHAHTYDVLKAEYYKGNLLSYHGQNLWWHKYDKGFTLRPSFMHCIPCGMIDRNLMNDNIKIKIPSSEVLLDALKIKLEKLNSKKLKENEKKLLFIDVSLLNDHNGNIIRTDHSDSLQNLVKEPEEITDSDSFVQMRITNSKEFLEQVMNHRFTLIPTAKGHDHQLVMDVLLMGGIPVMKRSSISSCYDDTDNQLNLTSTRGSLPMVFVDSWKQVTPKLLEKEWKRISYHPPDYWDTTRLFMDHWSTRISSWNRVFETSPIVDFGNSIESYRFKSHLMLLDEKVGKGKWGKG